MVDLRAGYSAPNDSRQTPDNGRAARVRIGVPINRFRIALSFAALCLSSSLLRAADAKHPDFGPNVLLFSPATPAAEMQAAIDRIYEVQQHNEFGPERNAILFTPGEYRLDLPIGFYTEVAGLGASPDAVHITGNVRSEAAGRNDNATTTFWRAAEGFSVTPTGGGGTPTSSNGTPTGSGVPGAKAPGVIGGPVSGLKPGPISGTTARATAGAGQVPGGAGQVPGEEWRSLAGNNTSVPPGTMLWAVSQAVAFRRMHVLGSMVLNQAKGWASGGWMSDSVVDGNVGSGTQQQWISRNSEWGSWSGHNWNIGVRGRAAGSGAELARSSVHDGGEDSGDPREAVSAGGQGRKLERACTRAAAGCCGYDLAQ